MDEELAISRPRSLVRHQRIQHRDAASYARIVQSLYHGSDGLVGLRRFLVEEIAIVAQHPPANFCSLKFIGAIPAAKARLRAGAAPLTSSAVSKRLQVEFAIAVGRHEERGAATRPRYGHDPLIGWRRSFSMQPPLLSPQLGGDHAVVGNVEQRGHG